MSSMPARVHAWRTPYFIGLVLFLGCTRRELKPVIAQPPMRLERGLVLQVLREGYDDGDTATKGDTLSLQFVGRLVDGGVFDDTHLRGATTVRLGAHELVDGLEQGVLGMQEGELRRVTVPAALGYGSEPQPGVPARSVLIFEVELIDVR